jgi:hypothetical protein
LVFRTLGSGKAPATTADGGALDGPLAQFSIRVREGGRATKRVPAELAAISEETFRPGGEEMKRSFFGVAITLAAAFAVALMPGAAAGTTSTSATNLSCNDGTNLNLALDVTALTALTNAVTAMTLYPAGDPALACSLSQLRTLSTSSLQRFSSSPQTFSSPRMLSALRGNGGNPQHDYAVGGGRLMTPCGLKNLALSAHVNNGTMTQGVGGTFNLTLPATNCGGGHLVSKVDCLQVWGPQAKFTALVTKSRGYFANLFPVNSEIAGKALDSATDMLGWSGTGSSCSFQQPPLWPVVNGNISVHDA